jgi:predicted transcriptional regulator
MKYRSRTDIISTILQAAMPGATKTRLMYSAFLSYAQIQEYVHFLVERRLISFEEKSAQYKLTEQGLHYLRVYDDISAIVSLDGAKASEKFLPHIFA